MQLWQALSAVSCILAVSCGFLAAQSYGAQLYAVTATTSATASSGAVQRFPDRPLGPMRLRSFSALPSATVSHQAEVPATQETLSNASPTTFALVTIVAAVSGYFLGRFSKIAAARTPSPQVAMAAFQSEYAPGARYSFRLRGAAEDAELKKKTEELLKGAQQKMTDAIDAMTNKFATVRTGRASPAMLDRIRVEYYGVLTPLKQVAGISIPDASTIVVSPFDRSSITAIEKAIGGSDLGLTPSNDGMVIRIKVPPLTEDRRKELVKTVAKIGEEGKVQIRNVRRDTLKAAEKLNLSEDAEAGFKEDIQKATDKSTKKVDDMLQAKEKEVTTV